MEPVQNRDRPSISCVMITLNEEDRVLSALKSAEFCQDFVVLDSGSTDRTREIAKSFGARVFDHTFDSFGAQKQRATELAAHDWILFLDADERISPKLSNSIQELPLRNIDEVYELSSQNHFLGRPILFFGGASVYTVRLFNRKRARFSDSRLHERILSDGPVVRLQGPLQHHSYRNVSHYIEKFNRYTSLAAEDLVARNKKPASRLRTVMGAFATFTKLYWIRGGFKNGFPGFAWCLLSSFYPVVKHIKHRALVEKI
jgi:glycosyltransferase involved in cell wall biosynthesis